MTVIWNKYAQKKPVLVLIWCPNGFISLMGTGHNASSLQRIPWKSRFSICNFILRFNLQSCNWRVSRKEANITLLSSVDVPLLIRWQSSNISYSGFADLIIDQQFFFDFRLDVVDTNVSTASVNFASESKLYLDSMHYIIHQRNPKISTDAISEQS